MGRGESSVRRLRRVSRVWRATTYAGSVLTILLIAALIVTSLSQYSYKAQVLLFGNYRDQLNHIDSEYRKLRLEFMKTNDRLRMLRELYPISSSDLHRVEKIRAKASLELSSLNERCKDAEFAVNVMHDPALSDVKIRECLVQLKKARAAVNAFIRAVDELENKYAGGQPGSG